MVKSEYTPDIGDKMTIMLISIDIQKIGLRFINRLLHQLKWFYNMIEDLTCFMRNKEILSEFQNTRKLPFCFCSLLLTQKSLL